jgi:hypothetical protein
MYKKLGSEVIAFVCMEGAQKRRRRAAEAL